MCFDILHISYISSFTLRNTIKTEDSHIYGILTICHIFYFKYMTANNNDKYAY